MHSHNEHLVKKKNEINASVHQGRVDEALVLAKALCAGAGSMDSGAWLLLAGVYSRCGNIEEIKRCCGRALELDPEQAVAAFNLAVAEQTSGDLDAAIVHYQQALQLNPDYPGIHANLGLCLRRCGDNPAAVRHLQEALQSQSSNPELLYNLGLALSSTGAFREAADAYQRAVRLSPGNVRLYNNLGSVLFSLGEVPQAIAACREAVRCDPESLQAWYNLSIMYWSQGSYREAYDCCCRALQRDSENLQVRQSFVQLFHQMDIVNPGRQEYRELVRSFAIPGVDVQQLALPCIRIIRPLEGFKGLLKRVAASDRDALAEGLINGGFGSLLEQDLFLSLLRHTVMPGEDIECVLTGVRRAFLRLLTHYESVAVPETGVLLQVASALAVQCFNNEYVYQQSSQEEDCLKELVEGLRQLTAENMTDPSMQLRLLVLAMYQPLYTLPWADKLMACRGKDVGEPLNTVLRRQLYEPGEESAIEPGIVSIGGVTDKTSAAVRAQYEDNPYPRWTSVTVFQPRRVSEVLRQLFPHLTSCAFPDHAPEMLIAGCGTGSHAIMSATRFANSRVLAIDLSRNSLSYAIRQANCLGIRNIEFAQADILELGSLYRTFDIIESVGVLHHMADPAQGLKILVDKLRPGGFMSLGFYSSTARRQVTKVRDYVVE